MSKDPFLWLASHKGMDSPPTCTKRDAVGALLDQFAQDKVPVKAGDEFVIQLKHLRIKPLSSFLDVEAMLAQMESAEKSHDGIESLNGERPFSKVKAEDPELFEAELLSLERLIRPMVDFWLNSRMYPSHTLEPASVENVVIRVDDVSGFDCFEGIINSFQFLGHPLKLWHVEHNSGAVDWVAARGTIEVIELFELIYGDDSEILKAPSFILRELKPDDVELQYEILCNSSGETRTLGELFAEAGTPSILGSSEF